MMGGYGLGMMGLGILGWLLSLFAIGIVVYLAVNLSIQNNKL